MYSWMNPLLAIRDTRRYGRGIFATGPIPAGSVLLVMGGHIVDTAGENTLGDFATHYNMDISEEHSFCPRSTLDLDLMPQHLINHSCMPNAGFSDSQFILAIEDIASGEEITYDYAFVMWSHNECVNHFTMRCECGTPACRGLVTESDWQLPHLQKTYGNYFQPFLRRLIQQMQAN